MHFGENQLSRSLIGLSPLPTAHPLHFQLKWVRSSTTSYRRFNLAMGRSLRFGSRSRHCNALFRLAFAPAPLHRLTLPLTVTRRLILQKARHHGHARRHDDALTACKPTVSGTISLPSRGTFHLSLTVLVHYRSPELYLALRGGPRRFTRNFPGPVLLGDTARRPNTFRVRDCYPLRSEFP